MKIYKLDYLLQNMDFFKNLSDKVRVYPTDTIYGIGTTRSTDSLAKVNKIKNRPADKMCSIIAPNIDRIRSNYVDSLANIKDPILKLSELEKKIGDLNQRYKGRTMILDYNRSGVRIIKHPFQKFVNFLGKPFISTSANYAGEPNIQNFEDLPKQITPNIDVFIDGGNLNGKPSVILDLVSGETIRNT